MLKHHNIQVDFKRWVDICQSISKLRETIEASINAYQTIKMKNVNSQKKDVLIHYCKDSSLLIYDISTEKKIALQMDQAFNEKSDSILFHEQVFIIGGANAFSIPIKEVHMFGLQSKQLEKKGDMLVGKYGHGLCIEGEHIYSIGGSNGAEIKDCQKYSVTQNKWTTLPYLNVERHQCAVFEFHGYIFALCGICKKGCLNTMEKIESKNALSWNDVDISKTFTAKRGLQAISIGTSEVLVFGDYYSDYKCESYVMTFKDDKIVCKSSSNLKQASRFFCTAAPVFDGENVYAVDSGKDIHIYSVSKKSWSIIKQ